MGWFLYGNSLRHERVKVMVKLSVSPNTFVSQILSSFENCNHISPLIIKCSSGRINTGESTLVALSHFDPH